MYKYAEPNKEFQIQDLWGRAHSVTLDFWLWWLKEKNAKWCGEIDPELQDMIMKLNTQGYITHASCAGHDGRDGYIAFYGTYTQEEIAKLLAPYYLKITNYELDDDKYWEQEEALSKQHFPDYVSPDIEHLPMTIIEFEGIGQSKRRKRTQGKQLTLIGEPLLKAGNE
ncbi:hypothetical protein ES708_19443 [subsurface metagenome]